MCKNVIVIGGGGHAKVAIDCTREAGDTVVGILDDHLPIGATVLGVPVLGPVSVYSTYPDCVFLIADFFECIGFFLFCIRKPHLIL